MSDTTQNHDWEMKQFQAARDSKRSEAVSEVRHGDNVSAGDLALLAHYGHAALPLVRKRFDNEYTYLIVGMSDTYQKKARAIRFEAGSMVPDKIVRLDFVQGLVIADAWGDDVRVRAHFTHDPNAPRTGFVLHLYHRRHSIYTPNRVARLILWQSEMSDASGHKNSAWHWMHDRAYQDDKRQTRTSELDLTIHETDMQTAEEIMNAVDALRDTGADWQTA